MRVSLRPVSNSPETKITNQRPRVRSGWTQDQLAAKEKRSQDWVALKIRFGRFLSFTTTVVNAETLPNNLTEVEVSPHRTKRPSVALHRVTLRGVSRDYVAPNIFRAG